MERTQEQDEAFKLQYNFKTLNDKVAEYTSLLTEHENLKTRLRQQENKTDATPIWQKKMDELVTKMDAALALAVQAKKDLKEMLCGTSEKTSCCEKKPAKKKIAKG